MKVRQEAEKEATLKLHQPKVLKRELGCAPNKVAEKSGDLVVAAVAEVCGA
jgi:hypothetical protein